LELGNFYWSVIASHISSFFKDILRSKAITIATSCIPTYFGITMFDAKFHPSPTLDLKDLCMHKDYEINE
jgi:hypothetical protein